MTPHKHMLSSSSLSPKNNRGTCQKWWGKWNHNNIRVGSMSLLNMALLCFVSGWDHLILFYTSLRGFGLSYFDLSSAHCLVLMTSDPLMSNTTKSTAVPPICSREVDLCRVTIYPWRLTHFWFITKIFLCLVSMMWETLWPTFDQGCLLSTSAHYPGW